ncbi:glycosyltransferase family 39 protein [Solitalea sp. MAHUQ-68]|uniref:Glycosyltransferase family 39 protein n=1 Tax=Solitalea agri TaxID=2953739 RepID=A0A9X2F193_9SPHI|nr:glycosyltransferase family 39 protein [Solitalea agri]MCO4292220.1 glycosyltransferase family 39 protein [Solitalea agri]
MTDRKQSWLNQNAIIIFFFLVKFTQLFFTSSNYELHRDEYLYLAEGDHMAWGYLEVPPLVPFLAFLTKSLFGSSITAVRLFPTLFGAGIVALGGLMAREMGGKKYAEVLGCCVILFSSAFVRVSILFMPVIVELFFWTIYSYLIFRYLNHRSAKNLIFLGIAFGLGMMTKYSSAFFIVSLLIGLALTNERKLFINRWFWIATAIAFIIFLPNLLWQYNYNFPVVHHMKELRETQLINVNWGDFLKDQLIMNLTVLPIWIIGLGALLFSKTLANYRIIGLTAFFVVFILMISSGKSYYTLGVYPVLLAAGAVQIEQWLIGKVSYWFRPAFILVPVVLLYLILPICIPYLPTTKMIAFGKKMVAKGIDGPWRWEDGKIHDLPQDYADMFGWEEIAKKVAETYHSLSPEEQKQTIIFCDNYGFAGAVQYYNKRLNLNLPEVQSLDASFMLWTPAELRFKTMIYVDWVRNNDAGAFKLFHSVKQTGAMTNIYSRERGTGVYLLQQPVDNIDELVKGAVKQERAFLAEN